MKRRTFLRNVGGLCAGAMMPRLWWPVGARALGGPAGASAADRILVLIVLEGGNDGLNTVVPVSDPLYYALRPTVAVPSQSALTLVQGTGLHPALSPLMSLWNQGRLAVVRDVSYPAPNLSHFRATDILLSGSSSGEVIQTGWLARWLEAMNPTFPSVLPPDPLGLQQGLSAQLLFQGDRGTTGVVVYNPSSFYWLVNSNYTGSQNDAPSGTRGGAELGYLRDVDRASFEYANAIQTAAEGGANTVVYPDSRLAEQLAVTAKLIDGGMNTPVYVTALSGFDTHAGQLTDHPLLLTELAEALAAFAADLTAMGRWQDVLVLTVSEFGRRVEENGSIGTDHGAAAPWFLLGGSLQGGLHGNPPDLTSLDEDGNLPMQVDYRSVYASVLQGWFGTPLATIDTVLEGSFPLLPFLSTVAAPEGPGGAGGALALRAAGANPARGPRLLRFTLPRAGHATIRVFDVGGRRVADLADRRFEAGAHDVRWDAARVARGVYFARLVAEGGEVTEKLVVE